MKTWMKILLIICGIALAVGLVLAGIGIATRGFKPYSVGWENGRLVVSEDTNLVFELEKTEIDDFTHIDVDVSLADVILVESDCFAIEYSVYGREPSYEVTDGTLHFTDSDKNLSFSLVNGFGVAETFVKIYFPADTEFESIIIENACGDVNLDNIKADLLEAELSCGNIDLTGGTYGTISMELSCGDIDIRNSVVENRAELDNKCGDIEVSIIAEDCGYELNTSCGNIHVNGLSADEGVTQSARRNGDGPQIIAENACGDIELSY